MKEEILRIENVIRKINGITYLDNITFNVFQGEIMGLLLLDSYGKGQLVELISKNVPIDFGRVYFADKLVNYYEHSNLTENPVYTIGEKTKLVHHLKVTDNISVLNPSFSDYFIREQKLEAQTSAIMQELEIEIDLEKSISELLPIEKAAIELIRAVISGSQLVILNSLSDFLRPVDLVFFQKLLLHYKKQGISFIYMTNHHDEVIEICSRIALYEKGRIVKVFSSTACTEESLEPYLPTVPHRTEVFRPNPKREVFSCVDLQTENLANINFAVEKGECLTIFDPSNRGMHDLTALITGELQPRAGKLVVAGKEVIPERGKNLLLDGVAYIPENPVPKTLFHNISYLENLTFLLDRKIDRSLVSERFVNYVKEDYGSLIGDDINASDLWELETNSLYKLVYLRLLLYNPKIVCITHPFAHADVQLRTEISELISFFKQSKIAVVILAISLTDALTVSDRILVLEEGKLKAPPTELNN